MPRKPGADLPLRVIEAVRAHLAGLGVDAPDIELIRSGANAVLHLPSLHAVARVATVTAEMRRNPADYLQRELAVLRTLVAADIPTTAPATKVDPGPHLTAEGWAFSLIEHRDLSPVDLESHADAVAVGEAYARLAVALEPLATEIGNGDAGHPWPEVDRLLQAGSSLLVPEQVRTIEEMLARLQATEPADPWRPVHGDAHKNNVAWSNGDIVWFDFEDANLRPLAWDLASLHRAWPAAGQVACELLEVDPGSPSMVWHHDFREVYALLWSLVYANWFENAVEPTAERVRLFFEALEE